MGQTGFDILDNGEALDIHYQYFEKYNRGKPVAEIAKWLRSNYSEYFEQKTIENNSHFWLGLALAEWETKALDSLTLEMVKKIIEQDVEAKLWGDDYPKRKAVLQKFLKKITKEKKTAKKPVKQRIFKAPFQKGDLITSPIDDSNNWGLMICLASSDGLQKAASCLFAITTFEKDKPATVDDFANIRVNREAGDEEYSSELRSASLSSSSIELGEFEEIETLKKIGHIHIEKTFCMDFYPSGGWGNSLEKQYSDAENISLEKLIQKPNNPYTEWAELLVFLNAIPSDDKLTQQHKEQFDKYYDFIETLKTKHEQKYYNDFLPFISEYLCIRDPEYIIEGI